MEIAALDFNPLLGGILDATAQCISSFSNPSGKGIPLANQDSTTFPNKLSGSFNSRFIGLSKALTITGRSSDNEAP